MANFDYKHLIALGVGAVLAICGSFFGVDFSKSCPAPAAVAAATSVAPVASTVPAAK